MKQCTNLTSRPIPEAATERCLVKMFSLTGLHILAIVWPVLNEKVILTGDYFFQIRTGSISKEFRCCSARNKFRTCAFLRIFNYSTEHICLTGKYKNLSFGCKTDQTYETLKPMRSDIRDTVDWDRMRLPHINTEKSEVALFDQPSNSIAIDARMDGFILEENLCFKVLWLSFPSKLDWGSYIGSFAKQSPRK